MTRAKDFAHPHSSRSRTLYLLLPVPSPQPAQKKHETPPVSRLSREGSVRVMSVGEAASSMGDMVEGRGGEACCSARGLLGVWASGACVCFGVHGGYGVLADGSMVLLLCPGSSFPSMSKRYFSLLGV